jgi:hypothetical protein
MICHALGGSILIFLLENHKSHKRKKEEEEEKKRSGIKTNSHTRHDFRRIVGLELYACITLRAVTWMCISHANSF